jgi:hypothetical protein
MLLKNTASVRVACEALGFAVDPGQTIEVENGYCVPRHAVPGTAAQEPVIRLLVPQLVPADDSLLADWLANRPCTKVKAPPPPTALDLQATGMSPGVAALAATGNVDTAPRPPTRPGPQRQGGR